MFIIFHKQRSLSFEYLIFNPLEKDLTLQLWISFLTSPLTEKNAENKAMYIVQYIHTTTLVGSLAADCFPKITSLFMPQMMSNVPKRLILPGTTRPISAPAKEK